MFSISIVVRQGSIETLKRLASMWRLVSFNVISRISRRLCSSLEDLGPSESPSWAISESQVTFALAQLPKLHARWWNQALLREKDYFVQYDDPAFFALGFGAAAQIVEQLGTWFDAPGFTQELMPMVAKKLSALQALYANRPFTLVHGDYHAKQLFFPSAAGGRFAVIDWQFPFIAQGAWDFARLLTLGLATVDRRARETEPAGPVSSRAR